jgi:hypothetical protein
MKKSKIYFIVPILALGIFFAYYVKFSSEYDAKQAAVVAADKAVRAEKLRLEAEAREKAINDANEQQKVRKQARKDRDAMELKQRDDKENAQLNASKADQEQQKLARQVDKLTKDVKTVKDEIAKIQDESKQSVEEEAFVREYVTKAEENQAKLAVVMQKIIDADVAAARAAALAAAEAKKNS